MVSNTTEASYKVALNIAKAKKSHSNGDTLIKQCLLDCAQILLDQNAVYRLKEIPLSNSTVNSRIDEMSMNIKNQINKK